MSWFDWFLIAWFALGVLITVGIVGKPRKPITQTEAVVVVLIHGALIAGLLLTRG